jgi:hypothetical protein
MKAATCMSGATAGGQDGGEGTSAMGGMMEILGEATPADEGAGNSENVEDSLPGFAGKALDNSSNGAKSGKKQAAVDAPDTALEARKSRDASENKGEREPFKMSDASSDEDDAGKHGTNEEESSPAENSPAEADLKDDAESPGPLALQNATATSESTNRTAKKSVETQDDFLIFGYTLSVTGRMHSIVIAELSDAQTGRYVATVPVDQLSPDELEQLQSKLDEFRADTPALRAPIRARWVTPAFTCTVQYKGRTSVGSLKNPQLISYRPIDRPLTQ